MGAYLGLSTTVRPSPRSITLVRDHHVDRLGLGRARYARQTLSLRSRDFVQAAIVNGESTLRIIFREILPNMLGLIVNTLILSTLGAILTETALDFLGVGSASQVTWGTMLN